MNIQVIDQQGKKTEELKLNDAVFSTKPNEALVHMALTYYQSSLRQGTHSAKTRAEVSGGGKKPWKQKGTGRARAGSTRSPLWRHGGVIFPPKPRSHAILMPKKMRKHALASVISDRANEGQLIVVSEMKVDKPKTKEFLKVLKDMKLEGQKVLFVTEAFNRELDLSSRNIEKVKVVPYTSLNIYDALAADKLIMTKAAAQKLGEVLA